MINYKVEKYACNLIGIMHGGAFATLVDITTTLAILKADKKRRKNVTIDLS